MPSNAYSNFEKNLKDVERLNNSHAQLNHDGRGKRGLGHLTRSGIFMLCAAWEVYHEELIKECVRIIVDNTALPKELPRPIRLTLINHFSNLKDKSKLLHIAGDGWKLTYINICDDEMRNLNSPKVDNLNKCYRNFLAVEQISNLWSMADQEIDEFVKIRGDIAHNGRGAQYIRINLLERYILSINKTVIENDKY